MHPQPRQALVGGTPAYIANTTSTVAADVQYSSLSTSSGTERPPRAARHTKRKERKAHPRNRPYCYRGRRPDVQIPTQDHRAVVHFQPVVGSVQGSQALQDGQATCPWLKERERQSSTNQNMRSATGRHTGSEPMRTTRNRACFTYQSMHSIGCGIVKTSWNEGNRTRSDC